MNELNDNRRFTNRLTNNTLAICIASILFLLTITSDAGITRTGSHFGRIEAFGSIFINGREMDTSMAEITIDGRPGNESDLRLGQLVRVTGVQDDEALPTGITRTGVASKVIVDDSVDGPITDIDANGRIFVLGQPVLIDETTIVDLLSGAESAEELSIGDEVEVHGFPQADGSVLATRIADKVATSEFEVTGLAREVTETSFELNELVVNYAPDALGGAGMNTGDLIEVKGSVIGHAGQLIATRIELLGPIHGSSGEAGEIEGIITRFDSSAEFAIGRFRIVTTDATEYNGGGPANLDINGDVFVRGDFDDDGMLVASSITLRGAMVRMQAEVYTSDAGSLTLLNISVTANEDTVFDDASSMDIESLSFGDIYAGDQVEVRSFKNPDSTEPLVVQRIRRVDFLKETKLQGYVTALGSPAFELQGVRIDTGEQTKYRNLRGKKISATEFFALMTKGSIVTASGAQTSNSSINATEVGFEID